MSNPKLRIKNTELDNLTSNLRGEVGEIITSWIILRHIMANEKTLASDDVSKDLANQNLTFVRLLGDKLADEIVARLSELAEPKIGRLNFYFASMKLGKLADEVKRFQSFVSRHGFQKKRNYDISHKELPEKWSEHKHIHIPYRILLKGVALALRLMKKFDRIVLGPAAEHLWPEMRKRRAILVAPARAAYMMLPYLKLSQHVRAQIIRKEVEEGQQVWSEMATTVNRQKVRMPVCRKWGAILWANGLQVLDEYPLVELKEIKIEEPTDGEAAKSTAEWKPITEQRQITTKFRLTETTQDRMTFAPVERCYPLGDGSVTDLMDIHINLDDKLKGHLGTMSIGDEKEFTLNVTVLTGYKK